MGKSRRGHKAVAREAKATSSVPGEKGGQPGFLRVKIVF